MFTFKKVAVILTAAIAAVILAGCGDDIAAMQRADDYSEVEGYYTDLAYEVKTETGVVTEQMYVVYSDEEHTDSVGRKDVFFDSDTGRFMSYTVTMGETSTECIINYAEGLNDSSYYTEMYYNNDGIIESARFDNKYPTESGEMCRVIGDQSYYDSGAVKTLHQEEYRDGELYEKFTREYDEEGNIISEVKD